VVAGIGLEPTTQWNCGKRGVHLAPAGATVEKIGTCFVPVEIVAAETSEQAAKVVPEADRRARSVSVARTGLIEIDFGSRGRVRVDEVPSPNAERFAIRRKAVRRVSDPARFRSSEG
jgi:hypothetical protein